MNDTAQAITTQNMTGIKGRWQRNWPRRLRWRQ
jgi:hypothetical protein